MRRLPIRPAILALILGLTASSVHAQGEGFLDVSSNLAQSRIFADTMVLGAPADGPWSLPASSYDVRAVYAGARNWSIPNVESRVTIRTKDTASVALNFPYTYRINTVPPGAQVLIEHADTVRALGVTPLRHLQNDPIENPVIVSREGFQPVRFRPGSEIWNIHEVVLEAENKVVSYESATQDIRYQQHRAWIDYLAGGITLAAGVSSVVYKFRANDLYDRYQQTARPSLRQKVKRYDAIADWSLVTLQAGITTFALRLILR